MNKKFAAALALLAFLPPVLAQETESRPLTVIDLRPKEEREGFGLAALEGKCNKDVFRIPDVAADPMKVDMLREDIVTAFGGMAGGTPWMCFRMNAPRSTGEVRFGYAAAIRMAPLPNRPQRTESFNSTRRNLSPFTSVMP